MFYSVPAKLNNLTHRHVAVSPSTNSELLEALKTGVVDSTKPYLLTATTQTSGRGQHGRTWQSPKGNVYLSLYHPLQVPLSGLLSLVVGYQLTRLPLIQNINRQRSQQNLAIIGVKWANDIGYYEKEQELGAVKKRALTFNKLAGILIEPVWIEHHMQGVIIGIGLNVNDAPILTQATQEGLDYRAISLRQIIPATATQARHNRLPIASELVADELYMPICGAALRAISRFQAFKHTPYSIYQFISDYTEVSALMGHKVIIKQYASNQPFIKIEEFESKKEGTIIEQQIIKEQIIEGQIIEGQIIEGQINGINPDGSLQLITHEGVTVAIYTGNITVLPS